MKQCTFFFVFLITGFFLVQADNVQSSYYHTFSDMHTFSSYYPRNENSPGEEATLDYIQKRLRELEVSYRTVPLNSFSQFHSFSSTIEAFIEGRSTDTLYFVFPHNHPPEAGVDESYAAGLSLALSFIEEISSSPPPVSLGFLFLGAEKGRDPEHRIGTRAFLQDFSPPHRTAFVYVDLKEMPTQIEVQPGGTGNVGPAWILERIYEALSASEVRFSLNPTKFQMQRIGLSDTLSPIDPYLEAGFPAVYIEDTDTDSDAPPVAAGDLIDFFHTFTEKFEEGIPEKWDTHYVFLQREDSLLLMTEAYYVLLILAIFAAALFYPFARPKHFLKYFRSIVRHFFTVPLLFVLMFLFLFLSTMLLNFIMNQREIAGLWRLYPLHFLGLKVMTAAFLFAVSQVLLRAIHLNRLRGSFYSASAIIFLLFDVVLLSVVDISLTIYGVWILLFAFLFSSTRSRIFKTVFLGASFTPAAVLLGQIFMEPHYEAIKLLLLSGGPGNFIITLNLLPLMLMVLRLRMLFHHPNPKITRRIVFSTDLLFGLAALSLTLILFHIEPYSPPKKQPLSVEERISSVENQRLLALSSPVEIGDIHFEGEGYSIDKTIESTRHVQRLSLPEDTLSIDIEKESFLERSIYSVSIVSPHPVEELSVSIHSGRPIVLYECDYPVRQSGDRREVTVYVGRFPPRTLDFSFTVPSGFNGRLYAETKSFSPPYASHFPKKTYEVDYRLITETEHIITEPVPGADTSRQGAGDE
ncbi:MAG: hypothetical protein ACLFMZ_01820 [Spirochaetaceae bacterium]